MSTKYYRKRIGMIVILFTFIPVLIYSGIYRNATYKERIEEHLSENALEMQNKVMILEEEVVRRANIIENIAENPLLLSYYGDDFESLTFVDRATFSTIFELASEEEVALYDEKPLYHADGEGYLYIGYHPDHGSETQYLLGKMSIEGIVSWFTEVSPNTYLSINTDDRIIYNSDIFTKENAHVLKQVTETPQTINFPGNQTTYVAFKALMPQYNVEFYIFQEDESLSIFRTFYLNYMMKAVLMLFISAVVTFCISLKLNNPFMTMRQVAKRIIDGDYDAKIEYVEDELLSLNLSFNEIAAMHRQKHEEFVQYAMTMLEKNENLTELNDQLEASYDQLKAITEMLEYSKEKYQALFDHIKEFIWVFDQEGILTYVNAIMCDKLGYTEEELLGTHFLNLFLRFDEEEIVPKDELIDQLLRRDYGNLSIIIQTKTGEELLVSANSKRIFKNGVLQGAQGTARSIEFEEMLQNRVIRKNREFEILKEITWSMANSRTLETLLENVAQKVEELFSSELCTIRIVEGEKLVYKMGMGRLSQYARTCDFNINEDFSGIAVKENRILRVRDFDNAVFYEKLLIEDLLEKVNEIIVIPLENKGVIHGTINIGLAERLKDSEIKILRALSNQASIGIEKMKLYDQLKEDYLNTIRVLATAVEAKDKYTEGHSYRVSLIAKRLGEAMGMGSEALEDLEIAGMLHDIGKIGIDDEILTKKGALTQDEYTVMKSHPTIGKRILEPIGLSDNIIKGIYLHHKRYDLTGYPENEPLKTLELYPAVIGVADALDAITSNRTYSAEKPLQVAFAEIKKYSGTQFSPEVVAALEKIIETDEDSLTSIIN
ncbi:MAG: HD domain-containing protein [Clostridia bacterium]|nr:HD domain-containing protein [Clostridia bacterium]